MSNPLVSPLINNLQHALDVRLRQHGLVTENLAQANTPQFKAKHVDFQQAFARAFDGASADVTMQRTNRLHMDAVGGDGIPTVSLDAPAWSADGNSVIAETEMANLTANNIQFNATVEVLSRQLALLEYAASDGGR